MIFTPFYTVLNKSTKILLGFLLLLAFVAITSSEAKAQNLYDVKGTVKKNRKKIEGAVITLYKGSSQVTQQTTTSSGRFDVKMELNGEYTLTISKPGHITKKFYFNTKGVPDDRAKEEFGGQDIEVSIFEMPKDPSVVSQINQILNQPMAKFYYDDKIKEIDFDKAYSQSMLDALSKLNQIEQEAIKKAEEEAKSKTALESAAASKYEAAIIKGDAAFGKKDYTTARAAYTDALSIKPGEEYPKGKIVEIEKLIADAAKNAAMEADYKAAIAKADAAMTSKNYDAAKTSYNDALKLKPAEAYPKGKLDEIAKLLADAAKGAELDAKYKAAIQKADAAFGGKTYDGAKTAYAEASALKPAEKYPKDKITEIDKILADLAAKEKADKELDEKYKAAIAKADKSFAAKTYAAAKPAYEEALKIKPNEVYPKTKIAEIDKIMADLAAKEGAEKAMKEKYDAAIAKGDKALGAKDYASAKAAFTEALGIKAAEQYPKDKITEIDKLLADAAAKDAAEKDRLAKEKALNDKYTAALAKGDAALAKKDYTAAKAGYNEALGLKSAEQYPKDKLSEIDKALADANAAAAAEKERLAVEAKYKAAVAKGDAGLKAKTYDAAKAAYNEALGIKSGEQYPKDKIAEIDALIAKEMGAKELDEKYKTALAKGDAAFKTKSYEDAKSGYGEALGFKPAEAYPKAQLAAIDKAISDAAAKDAAEQARLAKEKELAEKYAAAIAKGDAAFGSKDYDGAKAAYNEAIAAKAAEKYPKDKITEINAILAKEMGAKELEKKYADAVAKGDAGLGSKDYAGAKTAYTAASALKPGEQYPKDKLAEVQKALDEIAKEKDSEAKYKAAIAKGDAGLKAKTYDAAKAAYNEALGIKSGEQYPKDKIAEIDALIAKAMGAKELDEKYKAALAKADAAFKTKSYEDAKSGYGEALGFKPAEAYPKAQLAAIDKAISDAASKDAAEQARLAKEKELAEKYAAAIAKGDAAFGSKDYDGAKAAYNEAIAAKAAEKYPKDKITEINAILAKEMGAKELEKKYADAVAKGDAGLGSKDYAGAKSGYTAALALKPSEQYPKDKLAEVQKALDEIAAANKGKEQEAKYTAAIAKGDAAFNAKTYAAAKTAYNEALVLKPSEQYPKDKLSEIDAALADANAAAAAEKERLALEAKYKAAVAKGDAGLKAKTYDAAKAAYNEALGIKSGEQYPKDKIAEIDALIAKAMGAKELDEKYKAALAKADAAFKTKSYEDAKSGYGEALGFKPAEAYPKAQLAAIDKAISDAASKDAAEQARLAKEKELAEKYAAAIAKGDAAFGSKDYDGAKAAYNEAIAAKAAEKYPKDKITEINAILAKEMGAKELEKKYADAVAKGDAGLGSKDYAGAKSGYTAALALKPSEQYPKDKLAEVQKALDEIAAANKGKEQEAKYTAAIAKGDAAFNAKTYAAAKTAYNEALVLKPSEQYPKDKLSEIDAALADANAAAAAEKERLALEAKYKAAVAKGDAAFKAKTYAAAKTAYNEAMGIKSDATYPSDKIAEIDKLLGDLANKDAASKALNEKYAAAVSKGDAALASKDYQDAKDAYNSALALKSAEKYPKDKIAAIDAILAKEAGAQALTEKYKAAVTKADAEFTSKDYAAAKASYTEASAIKPTEQYPKDQLAKVNSQLADLAKVQAIQTKYEAAVAKADGLLAKKDYNGATAAYREAEVIKSTEPYPGEKIREINSILDGLAKQKVKDAQYQEIIVKADKLFELKDYKSAKNKYLDASLVKSSEQYPKDKVAEIEVLLKKKATGTTTTGATAAVNDQFKSELAKKYPEGITEESASENNAKVTRRIVVKGSEGHLYVRKETSFGPVYYFKDNVPITEHEFTRDTEVQ